MKAIVCKAYGTTDVMQLQHIPQPEPKGRELLIQVKSATVTAGDCEVRRFDIDPLYWLPARLFLGVRRPRKGILGQELAGEVVAIGPKVQGFQVGDAVFGATDMHLGSYAEYNCLPETLTLIRKPKEISFPAAATLPTGGLNALYFIRLAKLQAGQRLLINGAGGSIGTYALQLAKLAGAEVTAVDSAAKIPVLQELGADEVIDYTSEDLTHRQEYYDCVLDIIGTLPISQGLNTLRTNGQLLNANPTLATYLRISRSRLGSKKKAVTGTATYAKEDLHYLANLMANGQLRAVIDKTYPLEAVPEAHRYVETGAKVGHVVIDMLAR